MSELVVDQPKNQLSLVVVAKDIASGLQAFENRKAELITLKAEVEGLKIQSLEDKAGIKQVTEARKKLKAARVEIEKEGKSMRDPLTAISKNISAKENELVQIIEPTEKLLLQQEKWVKDEEIRVANEERRKEDERIQNRINRMSFYGYEIDFNMLKALSDEDFDKIVDNARREFEKEEAAKAEKARQEQAQREQDERDRAELKALREKQEAADKILKEREEEVTRKELEFKRQQEQADAAERKRVEEKEREEMFQKMEADAKLRRDRVHQLEDIGCNGQEYFARYDENVIVCQYDELTTLSDEAFSVIRDKHNAANAESKEKKRFSEEKRIEQAKKEAAEKALAEQKEREAEAKRQEGERLAAASDKQKFERIIEQFQSIAFPEVKSVKAKKLVAEVKDMQAKIIAHIKSKS